MARLKRGDTAIHVQYIRNRVNPALIVTRHGDSEVVAFFKDEERAEFFVETLAELLRTAKGSISGLGEGV